MLRIKDPSIVTAAAWVTAEACVRSLAWELPHASNVGKKKKICLRFTLLATLKHTIQYWSTVNCSHHYITSPRLIYLMWGSYSNRKAKVILICSYSLSPSLHLSSPLFSPLLLFSSAPPSLFSFLFLPSLPLLFQPSPHLLILILGPLGGWYRHQILFSPSFKDLWSPLGPHLS